MDEHDGIGSRTYHSLMKDPTRFLSSSTGRSHTETYLVRFFQYLRRVDQVIKSRIPSGCHCPICLTRTGHALREVLSAVVQWQRGLGAGVVQMVSLILVKDFLTGIVADFVRESDECELPTCKVPSELLFYWFALEIIAIDEEVSPVILIMKLERDATAVHLVHNYFFRLADRLATEDVQRNCGARCTSTFHGACFTLRIREHLLHYKELEGMMLRTSVRLRNCTPGTKDRICAFFGCKASYWRGDEPQVEVVAPVHPVVSVEEKANRCEPLRPCTRCHKAFYCSPSHAADSVAVHQYICQNAIAQRKFQRAASQD